MNHVYFYVAWFHFVSIDETSPQGFQKLQFRPSLNFFFTITLKKFSTLYFSSSLIPKNIKSLSEIVPGLFRTRACMLLNRPRLSWGSQWARVYSLFCNARLCVYMSAISFKVSTDSCGLAIVRGNGDVPLALLPRVEPTSHLDKLKFMASSVFVHRFKLCKMRFNYFTLLFLCIEADHFESSFNIRKWRLLKGAVQFILLTRKLLHHSYYKGINWTVSPKLSNSSP